MTDRVPAFGVPPSLRALLSGTALYGGSVYRDLYCLLGYTWPDLIVDDRDALVDKVGGSRPMAGILRGIWTSSARMLDNKRGHTRLDDRVFQTNILCSWTEMRRMLDERSAIDIDFDWQHGLPCPLEELRWRMGHHLLMMGEQSAMSEVMGVCWAYARRPGKGQAEILAAATGAELDEGAYSPRRIPGEEDLVDVLAQWRERGQQAILEAVAQMRGNIREAVTEAIQERPMTVLAALKQTTEAEKLSPEPDGPGVVVVPRIGGGEKGQSNKDAAAELKGILSKRLPLYEFPSDRRALVEEAAAEAPHARAFFERLVALQDTREHWALPPILAVGDPGGGKTTSVDRFFRRHGLHVERYACDGSSDSAAAGTPRRWLSGEVSLPLRATITAGHANPVLVWDEVNRAGGHRQGSGGTLRDALTSLLEPENARRYRDPYVEAEVDISHVLHVATANSLDGIAPQVRDRFVCLRFPLPTREHLPVLARRMALEIARRQGLPNDHGELDRAEIQALSENWAGGSLRSLKKLVEVAVRVRLQAPWATRH